tara:strand:+ start:291 stop:485 length:195 start_codon:yes stop_codon:yes gene_type:complete
MTVLEEIKRWYIEAGDNRNDGWIQQGFKDKLEEVCEYLQKVGVIQAYSFEKKVLKGTHTNNDKF